MNKNSIVYCILFFPLLFYAQEIQTELVNAKEGLAPGRSHSLVFKITNGTRQDVELTPEAVFTNAWAAAFAIPAEVHLQPAQTKIYILPIHIPAVSEKGMQSITLKLADKNSSFSYSESFEVEVLEISKYSMSLVQSQDFIKAGETIKASFLLKNEGNSKEELWLESGFASIQEGNSLSLLPGQQKIIDVIKTTSPNIEKAGRVQIKLEAISKNNPANKAMAYSYTQVIPIRESQDDVFHRFPVFVSGSYLGRNHKGEYADGFQGEIYGKGSLDVQNTKFLEFRALGPNRFDLVTFAQYDEYYANYRSDRFYIHLGDKTYHSSYLTEFSRYGRGGELKVQTGKWELGGFYNDPRFYEEIKDETHGYIKYHIAKKTAVKYGYLFKRMKSKPEAQLHFVEGEIQPVKNTTLNVEYAVSRSDSISGSAYFIQSNVYFPKINATATYLNASSGFSGYFTNTNSFTGNMRYRILPKLSASINYRKDARNYEKDTLYASAPYRENLTYGLFYNYMPDSRIGLYNGFQEYEDRMEPKLFHYYERLSRIDLMQKLWFLQFNAEAQFANTTNHLTHTKGRSTSYSAGISMNKFRSYFNFYGSYSKTNRYESPDQEQLVYGARIISHFSEKTKVGLFYQNSHYLEDYFSDRNLFELQLDYKITSRQEIALVGRYSIAQKQLENKDFSFSAKYTLRLDVPVKRIAEYGILTGNIANLGVEKTEGIRLYLNNRETITDKEGNFIFMNVVPNTYFLGIDRSTIGLKDIPNVMIPVQIEINGGENFYDFGLTSAGTMKGKIAVHKEENGHNGNGNGKEAAESIIVEISNGEQVFRKICALEESFDFTYLRPGKWKIKVYRNGLNKLYQIKNDTFEVELNPGEDKDLTIEVIRQKREIKYLQEGVKVNLSIKK